MTRNRLNAVRSFGLSEPAGPLACAECGNPVKVTDIHCGACGRSLGPVTPNAPPARAKSAPPGPVVIIGGVIAFAVVAIAVMMFLGQLRDSHGWGDLICHAKYGDPGFGSVWYRDIEGDNVCRPAPW